MNLHFYRSISPSLPIYQPTAFPRSASPPDSQPAPCPTAKGNAQTRNPRRRAASGEQSKRGLYTRGPPRTALVGPGGHDTHVCESLRIFTALRAYTSRGLFVFIQRYDFVVRLLSFVFGRQKKGDMTRIFHVGNFFLKHQRLCHH